MQRTEPRHSNEEVSRRGKEIYEKIRQQVDPGNVGKIIAIDIETGEWELDENPVVATDRLCARLADPEIFRIRIGYQTVYHFGGQSSRIVE